VTIIIRGDYRELERELSRIEGMPNAKMNTALDTAFELGYETVKADVHVQTSSLKNSGKKSTKHGRSKWEGKFSFGGPSTGVNNPVDYAIYELDRGGDHDFMKTTPQMRATFVTAIKTVLDR
jgi:hypothetical protein